MTTDAAAALLLREFVRFGIPTECDAVADLISEALTIRRDRYSAELGDLQSRLSQNHAHFITFAEYESAVAKLDDDYARDVVAIECDPNQAHFQRWRASDSDFKKLVVRWMVERHPECFEIEDDPSRTGDDHWHSNIVVGNYLSATGGNLSEAARLAADHINGQIKSGAFARKSADNPTELVEWDTLRKIYTYRRSAHKQAIARMIPDTFEAFYNWTQSKTCGFPDDVVASSLPQADVCTSWSKDERIAWGRLHRFHDLTAAWLPNDQDQKEYLAQARALITAFWQHRHAVNKALHQMTVSEPPSMARGHKV